MSAWTTCFRKLVIVCCISETKSWKSLMEGLLLFLEVAVKFPTPSLLPLTALQNQGRIVTSYETFQSRVLGSPTTLAAHHQWDAPGESPG